ncbi:uncharacterized protein PAC_12299 [Phialocephala subalpina]|uniref:SMP-30/Gluconolactonase/LRE-like region domain-containing protein n=1 Tax=Phialocephala subalpina TaxID=576137 RepID=A0A1L7XBK5_9HELO|nr:uncharacterized protein PAC_12299 [Phialocephala subalpina]
MELIQHQGACNSPKKLQSHLNAYFNTTNFVAFDPSFFDIIGPTAKVEHIITLPPETNLEAACFVKSTNQLFFAAWGFDHDWQYMIDVETNELKNITTDPPTMNAHGCVYYNDSMHVATDGGAGHYASIVKIDPKTLKAETLINNFYQQPFLGSMIWTSILIAISGLRTLNLLGTLYADSTGISSGRPNVKDPFKPRTLLAYDTLGGRPLLRNERLFSNSISYYCDGVRVSRNGLVFCTTGDGVDVIEPKNGLRLGGSG